MDRILKFVRHADGRGTLHVLDKMPFPATRIFTVESPCVFNWRGGHALRTCHQLLVPVKSTLLVNLDDGTRQKFGVIPGEALYLPPMTWIDYAWGTPGGGAAIVLASHPYDKDDYISDRDDFAAIKALTKPGALEAVRRTAMSLELCDNG